MAESPAKAKGGKSRMKRKIYEQELRKLQVELCRLQDWVKDQGLRVIIVFEGRDAAGKGGTIKALTERVSPRVFRVVALPAPSDREKTQMFIQRYIQHFPAAGEVIIFDRSWYNRAGVEYVMGFCTAQQHRTFLRLCPEIESYIVDGGIILIKFWLEVGKEEQERRCGSRQRSPAAVEAQPDGSGILQALVPIFEGARPHVEGDGQQASALEHRALG
jgi:polyphosphate kinase 2